MTIHSLPVRRARANGLAVRVRPVRAGDAPRLAEIFARLSDASRLARYLTPKRNLTAAELRYFTDIDHRSHEALLALSQRGEPVGVIRFIRDPHDPTSAEVAAEVIDEWQNRGVGSLLATRLAGLARRTGIVRITATTSATNRRAVRLLEKVGTISHVTRDGPTVSFRVEGF
jgi:RimJ/RimL family protein N-acetyltransferase